jgi:hypothetical protein
MRIVNPQSIRNPQSAILNDDSPQSAMTTFDLLLIGYGNVARRFASLWSRRTKVPSRSRTARWRGRPTAPIAASGSKAP